MGAAAKSCVWGVGEWGGFEEAAPREYFTGTPPGVPVVRLTWQMSWLFSTEPPRLAPNPGIKSWLDNSFPFPAGKVGTPLQRLPPSALLLTGG